MATSVDELVNILFEMIDEAKGVVLSPDKCQIERDKALDLLDDIRAQLPVELAEAKKLLNAKAEFIEQTKKEAEDIKKKAQEEAARMVSDDEITNQVRAKSEEIIKAAQDRTEALKKSANSYCEDLLRRTEEAVAEAYKEIQSSHANFRSASGSLTSSTQSTMYDAAADE